MTILQGLEFNIGGYDLVARALYAVGGGGPYNEVIVLNNNSTHHIVAIRAKDEMVAQVKALIGYVSVEGDDARSYMEALKLMVAIADDRPFKLRT